MNYNLNIGGYIGSPLRMDFIQALINKNNYHSYLEIGVNTGDTFLNIECDEKVGVDPDPESKATIFLPSDDFFAHIPDDKKFDIIFVDGLHEWHQCYRDIINSIRHLSPNGTIVCHDMNPLYEDWIHNGNIETGKWYGVWTGDVYKAFVELRSIRTDVETALIYDLDMGMGIIRPKQIGKPAIECNMDELDYTNWIANKQYLSGCIPYEVFEKNFLEPDYYLHNFAEF